jgi:hypothetical protein
MRCASRVRLSTHPLSYRKKDTYNKRTAKFTSIDEGCKPTATPLKLQNTSANAPTERTDAAKRREILQFAVGWDTRKELTGVERTRNP